MIGATGASRISGRAAGVSELAAEGYLLSWVASVQGEVLEAATGIHCPKAIARIVNQFMNV